MRNCAPLQKTRDMWLVGCKTDEIVPPIATEQLSSLHQEMLYELMTLDLMRLQMQKLTIQEMMKP